MMNYLLCNFEIDFLINTSGKLQPTKVDGGGGTTQAIALVSGSVGGK